MTPETPRIDRRFKGVGRINLASGTTNPQMKRKIERMLTALFEDGRLDILRAIRDRHVTFLQVYDAYRRHALAELPIGDTMPLLVTAMEKWTEGARTEYSAKHIGNLETARRLFEKHDATARVADLPRLLDELRVTFGSTHARSFNLARSAAGAFVRATLKKSHPLWLACSAVEPRKEEKRPLGKPLSVADMQARFPNPGTDVVDAIAWTMVTTGMGAKEYWGRWHVEADRIHIAGTKRAGRVRDVPLIRVPNVPRLSRDRFEKLFRLRFKGEVTPYDMRRTYVRWLELADIPRTRRKLYMGHAAGDVTDLYERAQVTEFLAGDAKKVRAFLGADFEASSPVSSPIALSK
jgi:hypothetical protein